MTTNRKLIRTVSNFIDLIQFHLICQKLAKFSGLNPKGPYLSKNRLSCLVPRRLSLDENFRIKEGEKEKRARRRSASHFLFPIVLCASSSVTRVSLAFSVTFVQKTLRLRRRQVCPLKKLECPPEHCWLGQIVLLKWNSGSDTAVKSCYLMSCNSTPSANPNTFSPTNIHTNAPANLVLRWILKQTWIPHSTRTYFLASGIRMILYATSGHLLKMCIR